MAVVGITNGHVLGIVQCWRLRGCLKEVAALARAWTRWIFGFHYRQHANPNVHPFQEVPWLLRCESAFEPACFVYEF